MFFAPPFDKKLHVIESDRPAMIYSKWILMSATFSNTGFC